MLDEVVRLEAVSPCGRVQWRRLCPDHFQDPRRKEEADIILVLAVHPVGGVVMSCTG